jgi:hypothetical protein
MFPSACVLHVLHALQFAEPPFLALKRSLSVFFTILRYIEVLIDLAICFPTRNRVAVLLQPFPCPNSYSFLPFYADKVPMYRNLAVNNKSCT